MSSPILYRAVICLLALTGAPAAPADDQLARACDLFQQTLKRVPADRLTPERTAGSCRLQLESRWSRITGPRQHPDRLLQVDDEGPLQRDGWLRVGREDAEGPNSVGYTLIKGAVRCRVEGRWDGGDAANPGYVPDERFTYVVSCQSMP